MKHYLDLIPISARVHKRQNRMTWICIVLAVFLVTAIFGMADMEIRSQRMQIAQSDGVWHVGFRGVSTDQQQLIGARPDVEQASWYGVFNYRLDEGYMINGTPTAVCGFDPDFLALMPAAALTQGSYPETADGAIVTQGAQQRLGLAVGDPVTMTLPNGAARTFTVTGFTKDTALIARSDAFGVFVKPEAFAALAPANWDARADGMYYVQFSALTPIQRTIDEITAQFGLDADQVSENVKILGLMGQSDNPYMLQLYLTAAVLAVLVMTAGILMIASSLNSNVARRTEFFGMLRCLGATRKQVIGFVRREALQWCRTAIPVGAGCSVVMVWILCAILRITTPIYFAELPVFGVSWIGVCIGAMVGLVTVLLAAQSPAKRAARVSPLAAVSGNATVNQNARRAGSTRFRRVETVLGVHHAKASRKNLILMSGSFAFSIILFLAFSPTIDFMKRAVNPLQPYAPDFSVVSADETCSIAPDHVQRLEENKAVKRVYGRMFANHIPATINGQATKMNLFSYEAHQFEWAKEALLTGELDTVQNGDGVLLVHEKNEPMQTGGTVVLQTDAGELELPVAGVLSNCPIQQEPGTVRVICSEETFRKLTGATGYTILDLQLTQDVTDAQINEIRAQFGDDVTFSDRRISNAEARGVSFCFGLFLYGFLAVIALISIFNVINSIGMSVSARMRQYGAMRAIGMSCGQLVRMIAAEATTYALGGLVIGAAAGIPINHIIFEKLVTFQWGDAWSLPISAFAVIVSVMTGALIAAVYGPAQRIRNLSIVDTISEQ